jgi:ribosomal-protein-alanine N-acetyltransferase
MEKEIILRSPRLIIRDYKFEDFSGVHEYACDPETVSYMTRGPNSEEDTSKFISLAISQQTKIPRANYHFVVVLTSNERIIGGCGIHIRDPKQRKAEIGYCFNKSYWRRGYATEAAGELLRFGFTSLDLHRIIATCDTQNIASANVL